MSANANVQAALRDSDSARMRRSVTRSRFRYVWLLLPAAVFYAVFFLYPTAVSFRLSFFDWNGIGPEMNWVGLDNFRRALTSPAILGALWHTVAFFLAITVLQSTIGLFIAMLLNERPRFHQLYRVILFIPVTLSLVNTGFMWQLMLSAQVGLVNPLLRSIGLGFLARPWLAEPATALPTVILVQAWQWMGLPIVVFLAGLQSVRQELIEAAAIEGAGRWITFWHVVFPQLAPAFTSMTMLSLIRMFKVFDIVYVLEGITGSPAGRTSVLGTVIYGAAFGTSGAYSTVFQMSYAMSLAVLSSVLLLILAAVMLSVLRRRERDLF